MVADLVYGTVVRKVEMRVVEMVVMMAAKLAGSTVVATAAKMADWTAGS